VHCERCSNTATIHVTEVVGGAKRRAALCSECARQRGVFVTEVPEAPPTAQRVASFGITARCPGCHTNLATLRRTGRAGCPQCYGAFRPQLRELLQRVHGQTQHRGHRPTGASLEGPGEGESQ
jgi:protein arginine kinase activator